MKRFAAVLCGVLLLLTACEKQPPGRTEGPSPQVSAAARTPGLSPTAGAVPSLSPEPTAGRPTTPPEPPALTLEEARALIEEANAVLAPFLGEVPAEGEPEPDANGVSWMKLSGYTSLDEILAEMKAVFQDELAEDFFNRYTGYPARVMEERNGGVWVRTDSREILGHYYDMDLETLAFFRNPALLFSELALTAEGFGNDTPVRWGIGLDRENGAYQISYYTCCGTGEYGPLAVELDGVPYGFSSVGSPDWLGEPYRVLEKNQWWDVNIRVEYYPGLRVALSDRDDPGYHPWYITVTDPGMPTSLGVEVGDSLRDVLRAYPQFDMMGEQGGEDMNGVVRRDAAYCRCYPWTKGEYQGDMMYFLFDENFILQKIYLMFDISN